VNEALFAAVCVEGGPCLVLNVDSIPVTLSSTKQDESQQQQQQQQQRVLSPGAFSFILIDCCLNDAISTA
jgi:hypothetical protein